MADPTGTIKTLLSDNWNSTNTNSLTPNIDKVWNFSRLDVGRTENGIITLYPVPPRIVTPAGVGGQGRRTEDTIVIDIRTMKSEAQSRLMLDEVNRICNANLINPTSDYSELDPDEEENVLHDKSNKLFRITKEVILRQYNEAR